ncbi:MAG: hypothetical protein AAGA81_25090 [Acidobacteriota bacterium]
MQRLLVWFLRFDALILTVAFAAVFLPTRWMVASHASLGLGELPQEPIIEYLTRSVAVMYATRGLFVWLASTDTEKYADLIRLIGATNVLIGAFLFGIDLFAGMPLFWVAGEGPVIAGVGVAMLWLQRRAAV